ncbi:MAG: response regulator transcription factor [Chloroflexi bacterium]|nr:response regulator transcription factor [Chloroflexota bacterium]
MSEKILIIDDDPEIMELMTMILEKEHFEVIRALSARHGLRQAFMHHPNLILLDVMMPDMDGWDVCKRLRELSDVPIIFISARSGVEDVVKGLDLGGDDYLVKPFSADELVARLKMHLRRTPQPEHVREVAFDSIQMSINFDKREVKVRDEQVDLSPKEFNLLAALVKNSERVMTREELVAEAWGPESYDAVDYLKLYILYLRRKLERNPGRPELILTTRGVGYRFNAPN